MYLQQINRNSPWEWPRESIRFKNEGNTDTYAEFKGTEQDISAKKTTFYKSVCVNLKVALVQWGINKLKIKQVKKPL